MARATKADALETRARILDAAVDVFYARGVVNTSLEDIARAAGVTRGAIYWHFKNKADLFNAMCEQVHLPMEAIIDANVDANTEDPVGGIVNGLTEMLAQVTKVPRINKTIDIIFNKCEIVDPDDQIRVRENECRQMGRAQIEDLLRLAVSKQQLPADCDVQMCQIMLHAMVTGLLRDWFREPGVFDMALQAERILRACFVAMQLSPTLRAGESASDGKAVSQSSVQSAAVSAGC